MSNQWVVFLGIALTFVTALLGFLQSRENKGKITEVRVLVNHSRDLMLTRNKLLAETLRKSGIDVPDDVDPSGEG